MTNRSNRSLPRAVVTIFATAMAVLLVASTAFSFTPPNTPGGYRGGNKNNNNNNNNRNQNPNTPPPAEAPKVDTTGLDQAKKDAAAARSEQQKAQVAVGQARAKLMKEFDSKPETIEAKKKVDAARAAYDATAAPVIKSLSTRSDYKTAQDAATKADENAARVRADANATPEARSAAAKESLEAHNAMTKVRNDALAADPKIGEAKKALDASALELSKLRQDFEKSISTDPEIAAAQQALDDAKAKTKQADEAVAAAKKDIESQRSARAKALADQRKAETASHQQGAHSTSPK